MTQTDVIVLLIAVSPVLLVLFLAAYAVHMIIDEIDYRKWEKEHKDE